MLQEITNNISVIVSQLPSVNEVITKVTTSEVFLGFAALSIVGGLLYFMRGIPAKLWTVFLRQYTVEIELRNKDNIYDIMLLWLYEKEFFKKSRRLRIGNAYPGSISGDGGLVIYPGDGFHILWHKYRPVFIIKETAEDAKSNCPMETFKIRTIGRGKKFLYEIIQAARDIETRQDVIRIYEWAGDGYEMAASKLPRPIDSVIIDKEKKKFLIDDIQWFFDNKDWYLEHGIPWHRGYMFDGPPGTGKTSLILALASLFGKNIYYLNLNSVCSDNEIQSAFRQAGKDAFIIMEDADTAGVANARNGNLRNGASPDRLPGMRHQDVPDAPKNRNNTNWKSLGNPKGGSGKRDAPDDNDEGPLKGMRLLSLSGILNAIDGIASADGRVLFMTTNDPEKLDAALVRPGRIDVKMHIGYPGYEERKELWSKFFPDREDLADAFAEQYENKSPADIQGIIMKNLSEPDNIVSQTDM